MNDVTVHHLGRVEYDDGLKLQTLYEAARKAGTVGDTLMLLQHPPVLTMGRGAKASNVLAPAETLAKLGVELVETDRGGDVTYHGPGQIVGYPLLHLGPGQQDVRRYVRRLEEVLISERWATSASPPAATRSTRGCGWAIERSRSSACTSRAGTRATAWR